MMFHVKLFLAGALVVAGWWTICWLSPMLLARGRVAMPEFGIPHYMRDEFAERGISVYLVENLDGYANSCLLLGRRTILVDIAFFHHATSAAVEFVLAHELAHHRLGHVLQRLSLYATGLVLLDRFQGVLERQEHQANAEAERITGLPRTVVWGIGLNSARDARPPAGGEPASPRGEKR